MSSTPPFKKRDVVFLENTLLNLPNNVYWKDRDGYFLGCNDNVSKIFKKLGIDSIVGKRNEDIMEPYLAEIMTNNDNDAMAQDKSVVSEEHGFNEFGPCWYLTTKVPWHDADGNVIGLIGISVDISQRKKMEQELFDARERVRAANLAKFQFIQNLQHDLRTPFSGIRGLAEFLASTETNEERRAYLEAIMGAADEALLFCSTHVDFSRTEEGSLPSLIRPVKLRHVVSKVVGMEQPAAKLKGLCLEGKVDDNVPEIVNLDQYKIERILINFLSNAIKFSSSGSVKLHVRCPEGLDSATGQALLHVLIQDDGEGMGESQKKVLTQGYVETSSAEFRKQYAGSGLGLRLIYQFVVDLKGFIQVENRQPKGTQITCVIPVQVPSL